MQKRIVVIGSANTDMILKVPRIPKPGETILGGKFHTAAGGKGANQAVAAARAGGQVTFITRVGRDSFGKQTVKGLIKEKINADFINVDETEPSGIALIFVGEEGENCIGVSSGANFNLSPEDIHAAQNAIISANIILVQLEIPLETVRAAIDLAKKNRIKVILNPAPAQKLKNNILKNVHILTPNQTEAEILSGVKLDSLDQSIKAAKRLLTMGVKTIILTMGDQGALVVDKKTVEHITAFDVSIVDTTAAGDVFNGALAVALSEAKPILEATQFACAAAALSVTKLGAQPSAPTKNQIHSFLLKNR
jgi:ribokinase